MTLSWNRFAWLLAIFCCVMLSMGCTMQRAEVGVNIGHAQTQCDFVVYAEAVAFDGETALAAALEVWRETRAMPATRTSGTSDILGMDYHDDGEKTSCRIQVGGGVLEYAPELPPLPDGPPAQPMPSGLRPGGTRM